MPDAFLTQTHHDRAQRLLADWATVPLGHYPTPVEEMRQLRTALGGGPRLLVKRDDAISFAWGGNKVRKLEVVAAEARAQGADTLITTGGIQSNHARVTAAAAAKLGFRCLLVLNGSPQSRPTGNALLNSLLGAEVEYVATREDRVPAAREAAERLRRMGHRPYEIPLGASTPLGAIGIARAIGELLAQGVRPDVIVHSTSSGGTQAGLVAGCLLCGLPARIVGVSADEPADALGREVATLADGVARLLGVPDGLEVGGAIEVDDTFVGGGYGVPTEASTEASELAARTEALFLDHAYAAKAMAALIAGVRAGTFDERTTVLFWHTGGQVRILA